MEDPNQIEVPPSFTALFASPSGLRLLPAWDAPAAD